MIIPKPAQWALNVSLFITYWFVFLFAAGFVAYFCSGVLDLGIQAEDVIVGIMVILASSYLIYLSVKKTESLYITKK